MAPSTHDVTFEAFADRKLSLLLFQNVENVTELRAKIASSDVHPEFCLLNAALVSGILPVHLAAYKALVASSRGKMVTKSLHVEVLAYMSGRSHVGESIKKFGVSDGTQHLLLARFDATPEDVEYAVGLVKGTLVPLDALQSLRDQQLINQVYKISDKELKIGSLEEAVACRIASRDC